MSEDTTKRFIDKPYGHFKPYVSGLAVKCPHCGGMGSITVKGEKPCLDYLFACDSCGKIERKPVTRRVFRHHTPGICVACGRYFNGEVTDERMTLQKTLWIACPHCGARQQCRVEKTDDKVCFHDGNRENVFGYPLWFRAEFDGQSVWALNREHLSYLIDYIGAELREDLPEKVRRHYGWGGTATESDRLPKFMKLAKNRERLLKLLRRMQEG